MPQGANQIPVIVVDRKVEADGIVSLVLGSADGSALPAFDPGAHVDIHLGDGLIRQYSLCNLPSHCGTYRLGVLLEDQSRGGSRAVHQLGVGDQVLISAPRNNFRLVETAGSSVLVAGGIGITPLLAMAHRLHAIGADFELHYCARTRTRAAFLEELPDAPFAARVSTHFDDETPDQTLSLERDLGDPAPDRHLYVCGPSGFMDYVIEGAKSRRWDPDCIHMEYFNADVDATGDSFTVIAQRSGLTIEIPADKAISEMLYEKGIVVPLSCEQGVCGTCLTPVLEGIPDHRDLYQTEAEKATNKEMTICCSRAKSAVLVLDL